MAQPESLNPIAFMSYVDFDDQHDDGRLTELGIKLGEEISMHTGEDFAIFQDRRDPLWSQLWTEWLVDSVDGVTFLIPIITPRFFTDPDCRSKLEAFFEQEKKLRRNDIIFPIYYVRCPLLSDPARLNADDLAREFATHQWGSQPTDWLDLRFEPITSPEVGRALQQLALQIRDGVDHGQGRLSGPRGWLLRPRPSSYRASEQKGPEPVTEVDEEPEVEAESTAEPEPRTRIVDPIGRGDHTTISEAIERSSSGDRILVRPDLYQEGLYIDKPLEIIGDGDLAEIVVQASGVNAIPFQTTMGRVANLTLRQMDGGEWFCVNSIQGRPFLEDCDVSSESLACVAINAGADPRLQRNRIHDSKQSGVIIYDQGLGTLEDNDIFGNSLSGVEIRTGGNPTLRGNRVYENKESGIYVYDEGIGNLEDNDVFRNARAGMRIGNTGNPAMRHNRINKNGIVAVWAPLKGGGDIEDNDLRNNAYGAWLVSADSEPLIKRARNQE